MSVLQTPEKRRTAAQALGAAVLAWSPPAYEARLVFAAVLAAADTARGSPRSGPD